MGDKVKHQGSANYATFSGLLFVQNDREADERWRRNALNCVTRATAEGRENPEWTQREYALFTLADRMKAWAVNDTPELPGPWSDLLQSALNDVVWYEIAAEYLSCDTCRVAYLELKGTKAPEVKGRKRCFGK